MNKINIHSCVAQEKISIFTAAKINNTILTKTFYDDWLIEGTVP